MLFFDLLLGHAHLFFKRPALEKVISSCEDAKKDTHAAHQANRQVTRESDHLIDAKADHQRNFNDLIFHHHHNHRSDQDELDERFYSLNQGLQAQQFLKTGDRVYFFEFELESFFIL
jgi:hypothetical protein